MLRQLNSKNIAAVSLPNVNYFSVIVLPKVKKTEKVREMFILIR